MKKIFMILSLIFILTSCNNEPTILDELQGKYYFQECIYLNPLLSVTMDAYTYSYKDNSYIEFNENQIIYLGTVSNTYTYENITFVEEEITKDLDSLISLDFEGVFDTFDNRYDLYSDDKSINITIFVNEEAYYIANTKMIGGSNDILTVWNIFEISK